MKEKLKALLDDPKWQARLGFVHKYLWPHFLLPLLAIVILDYAKTLAWITQAALTAWMLVSTLGFGAGLFIALVTKIKPDSPWAEIRNYRLWDIFPTARWGDQFVSWVLEEKGSPDDQPIPREVQETP